MNEDTNKYLVGIETTGFGLEYEVSRSLVSDGWTVINNKYYIDDVQGSSREIDILAYKVSNKNKILVYTVLIVSCKKSADNVWALLAKQKSENDPNIDWHPVTLWSNQKILRLMIENYNWKERYLKDSSELYDQLLAPSKHIFAFQELNKNKGSPQNDKAIFNSIISTMKSQDYEINSLEKRKKEDAVYNFNLVSVVDAPLYRVNFGEAKPEIESIESDIYVGSYIINKRETISRVHIVCADKFSSYLPIYSHLHKHNVSQSAVIKNSYFENVLADSAKVDLFIKDFNREVRWIIYTTLRDVRRDEKAPLPDISIFWNAKENKAEIEIESVHEESELEALNSNRKLITKVSSALKKIYGYEGDFTFTFLIPF